MDLDTILKLMEKVRPMLITTESGCVEYPKRDRDGYSWLGQIAGHRAAMCEREGRVLTRAEVVDHIVCRNRACMNAEHLRIVDWRTNSIDNSIGLGALNAAKTCCPKCGGDFIINTQGKRVCKPCKNAKSLAIYHDRYRNDPAKVAIRRRWRSENKDDQNAKERLRYHSKKS